MQRAYLLVLLQTAEEYAQEILAEAFLHSGQARVDKKLGVGHGMYDGVGDTIFTLNIQHDPSFKILAGYRGCLMGQNCQNT